MVIIEVQCHKELDFLSRVIFNTSKISIEHMRKGDAYSNVRKVISVNILYCELGAGSDYIFKGKYDIKGYNKLKEDLLLNVNEKRYYSKIHNKSYKYAADLFPEHYYNPNYGLEIIGICIRK